MYIKNQHVVDHVAAWAYQAEAETDDGKTQASGFGITMRDLLLSRLPGGGHGVE